MTTKIVHTPTGDKYFDTETQKYTGYVNQTPATNEQETTQSSDNYYGLDPSDPRYNNPYYQAPPEENTGWDAVPETPEGSERYEEIQKNIDEGTYTETPKTTPTTKTATPTTTESETKETTETKKAETVTANLKPYTNETGQVNVIAFIQGTTDANKRVETLHDMGYTAKQISELIAKASTSVKVGKAEYVDKSWYESLDKDDQKVLKAKGVEGFKVSKIEKIIKELPDEYVDVYLTKGVKGLNEAIEADNKKYAEAEKALSKYKDKDGNYDVVKYLRDNKDNMESGKQTLKNAGFADEDIKEAAYNAKLNKAQQVWQSLTPWEESKGETATLKGVGTMAAELVVPGVYQARHWNEMSNADKALSIALDVVSLIPVAGAAAKGAKGVATASRAARGRCYGKQGGKVGRCCQRTG